MSEYSLKPLTALGDAEPRVDRIGAVTITEIADNVLASLAQRHGKEKPFATAAKKAFGSNLPGPGTSVTKGDFSQIWVSPEQWLVEASSTTHEDIASILKGQFEENASITEQTGGWVRFDIDGNACVALLQRLTAVDSATMPDNAAIRTVIEHIGVYVLCRKEKAEFSIYGPRSSAGSLHHALITAASSIA